MSLSLIITNFFFCTLAGIFIFPALRDAKILTYKRGFPLFIGILAIFLKIFLPFELGFTETIASTRVMPALNFVLKYEIYGILIFHILLSVWLFVTIFLLARLYKNHCSLMSIFSSVKMADDKTVLKVFYENCRKKSIEKIPKVVVLDIKTSPFIIGYINPIIVLPNNLDEKELNYVLAHELEHYKNNHLAIKLILEILTAIFWWYPLVWMIKKYMLHSLELQVDSYLTSDFDEAEKINYAKTVIDNVKKRCITPKSALAFSFVGNKLENIHNRVAEILASTNITAKKKFSGCSIVAMILSIVFFVYPIFYTYEESYDIPKELAEGTTVIDKKNSYFVKNGESSYDAYFNGEYIATMKEIPDLLTQLPVYSKPR